MAGNWYPFIKIKHEQQTNFCTRPGNLCCWMLLVCWPTWYRLGEFGDIVWAPVSGFLFYKLFGGRFGLIGGVLNFLEEIIPLTDIIPSFTIAWFIRKNEAERLRISQRQIKLNLFLNNYHGFSTSCSLCTQWRSAEAIRQLTEGIINGELSNPAGCNRQR